MRIFCSLDAFKRSVFFVPTMLLSLAMDAPAKERTWVSASGTKIVATLEGVEDFDQGKEPVLLLRGVNGRQMRVRLQQLSPDDQRWFKDTIQPTLVPSPTEAPSGGESLPGLQILTPRDVKDPGELIALLPEKIRGARGGIRVHDLSKLPPWADLASWWFEDGFLVGPPRSDYYKLIDRAVKEVKGGWEPFPEAGVNELLKVLTAYSRKPDGAVAVKRVNYKSTTEVTKEDLKKLSFSAAYVELEASIILEGNRTEGISLVLKYVYGMEICFLHQRNEYTAKLDRIDRGVAESLGVQRNEGLQISELSCSDSDGSKSELLNKVRQTKGVILLGGKWGKMVFLCPEFDPAKGG